MYSRLEYPQVARGVICCSRVASMCRSCSGRAVRNCEASSVVSSGGNLRRAMSWTQGELDTSPVTDSADTVVRVLPAAEYESYEQDSIEAFWRESWKVTPQSDRYGYRLGGPVLISKRPVEMRSHGIVPGVIQVPPSGQPIIQLRDAQPSGGYPKIGTVIEADLWRLAQARIGSKLRFVQTSYEEAVDALDELDRYMTKLRNLVGLHRGTRP